MKIYKCNVCGNVTEMIHDSGINPDCCGQSMEALQEKYTETEGNEKHVPVIEIQENHILVKVGEVPHPMQVEHFINMIELITDQGIFRKNLKPTDKPEAKFPKVEGNLKAREYCNLHELWKSEA